MRDLPELLAAVDAAREEIISLHQDIVRIPTVNSGQMPTGNETACCEYLQTRLAREGIGSEILESAPTRGNLIARLKGDGTGPSLLFMSHLDVVPVGEESDWKYPPFSGELAGGKIWGRGSSDCKSVTTAAYFAMALLKREGPQLKGDLIFTGTADEESGGFYGYGWLAEQVPEKIAATYAINEGGGATLLSRRGLLYDLGIGEKGRLEVTISIAGRSGHAARPWSSDNALEKAGKVLAAIAAYKPEIDLSHPLFQRLGEMVAGVKPPTLETAMDVIRRVAIADQSTAWLLQALSQMTLTPTVLQSGAKSNSIPASALLKCDARTLPGQDADYVRREIEKMVAGIPGVDVQVEVWARSTQSPFDTPFTRMLGRSLELAIGRSDVRLAPSFTTGFTDSQYVRPLGVQAYGFSPIHPEGDAVGAGVHGVDENIDVETLIVRTKAYLAAAYSTVVEGLRAEV